MRKSLIAIISSVTLTGTAVLAQTTTTAPVAPGTSTVAAPASPAKKTWGVSVLQQFTNGIQAAQDKGGANSLTQLTLSYKLNTSWKLALIQSATGAIAGRGETQNNELTYSDLGLAANTTTPSFLSGGDPAALSLRYYAPTSEAARLAGSHGKLRVDYSLASPAKNKVNGEIYLSLRDSLNAGIDTGLFIAQPALRYSINDSASTYAGICYTNQFSTEKSLTSSEESLGPAVGVDYSAHSNIDLNFEISQSGNPRKAIQLFDTASTEYSLLGIVRF